MPDKYDGVTIGDFITELYFKQNLVESEAFNNAYRLEFEPSKSAQDDSVKNIGSTDSSNVYEIVKAGTVGIQAIGQNGDPEDVSHSFGLGIRQHDDVMLAYGYSRKTTKKFTIPSGQYAAITLTVGAALAAHHAENRFVESYNGSLEFKVIVGKELADMTGTPVRMSAFNQNGAALDGDVKSLFDYYAPAAANMVGGVINEANTIDDFVLYGQTAQGVRASSADAFGTLQGRHYNPDDFIVVSFHNPNGSDIDIEYVYAWHEY